MPSDCRQIQPDPRVLRQDTAADQLYEETGPEMTENNTPKDGATRHEKTEDDDIVRVIGYERKGCMNFNNAIHFSEDDLNKAPGFNQPLASTRPITTALGTLDIMPPELMGIIIGELDIERPQVQSRQQACPLNGVRPSRVPSGRYPRSAMPPRRHPDLSGVKVYVRRHTASYATTGMRA